METKKVMKRLLAVGAGALMLGATAMGALAADLKDYPAFFVKDGSYNGYLVVGEKAAAVDNLAMTDIAAGMKYLKSSDTKTTTVSGDAWQAKTSTNKLELGETINSVATYISASELQALGKQTISNNKGTSTVEQYLYFDISGTPATPTTSGSSNVVKFVNNGKNAFNLYYFVASGNTIGRYKATFSGSWQSDYATSGTKWKDYEGKKITLMGKSWDIVRAENTSGGPKLTLMGGSAKGTLNEGEKKTYTFNGKDYVAELAFTNSDNKAKFVVNGESTDLLQAGETFKLTDGTIVGATEVLYQNYAGGVHSATFFVGADKMVLKNGTSLTAGDKSYSETPITIDYAEAAGVMSINSITVNVTARDDFYVPAAGKLSSAMKYPEAIFGGWDILYSGVKEGNQESVKLTPYSGDEKYKLEFTTSGGNKVALPLMYSNSTATSILSGEKDGYELVFNSTAGINKHQYFVLNTATPTTVSANSKTYVVQYDGRDKASDTDPKARFTILGGDSIERSVASDGTFDIKLGGATFNFVNGTDGASPSSSTTQNIKLTSTDSSSFGMANPTGEVGNGLYLRTSNNALIRVVDTNFTTSNSTWYINVSTDDTTRMNTLQSIKTEDYTFAESTGNTLQATVATTPTYWVSNPDNSNQMQGYDMYGTKIVQDSPSSGSRKAEWTIPDTQTEALVYVTSGAVTSASSADGSWTAVAIVDATKLDSEVLDTYKEKNMIVVGGPCVNTVSAALLGSPANCADGFTPGKSKVKLFENGDKVAMLVAGYSGDDTRVAGKFVSSKWKELKGKEMEIETATSTASAPVAKVEVVAPAAAAPAAAATTTQ